MSRQRHTDRWVNLVRRWLAGTEDADGRRYPLPGMPEPFRDTAHRAVALVLADLARHDGTGCRPSRSYVARVLGCSERTVQRATVEMVRLGLLRRVNRAHRGQAQEYELTIPGWLEVIHSQPQRETPVSRITDRMGDTDPPERETPVSPLHKGDQARAATWGSRGAGDSATDTTTTATPATDVGHQVAAAKRAAIDAQFASFDLTDPSVRARHRAALQRQGIDERETA